MKTTLVIMAAGLGSRFGEGIKQLTKLGPDGEIIMDYSIYDAKEAGFDKVVFVIRKEIEEAFKEIIGNRIAKYMDVDYVFQEVENLPEGFTLPEGRTKPWGTGHAILAAKDAVSTPFVFINADDYYGKNGFKVLHDFLVEEAEKEDPVLHMAMAGFALKNTVSENGTVNRGICMMDENRMLQHVIEGEGILIKEGKAYTETEEIKEIISPESNVSMNMWAVPAGFMAELDKRFTEFLSEEGGDPLKKEYMVPVVIDDLIREGKASVKVLPTDDKWIGVTYQQDTQSAREKFAKMAEDGMYPRPLWA
jgi:dTDP-glucose pyrophosphorylase